MKKFIAICVAAIIATALFSVLPASGQPAPPDGDAGHSHGDEADHTHDHSDDHSHSDGLARYGPSGPIERTMLPGGVDTYVSDEAIEMAQRPELAAARAAWEGPVDFVDQVDYQLSFRDGRDYLSTEPDHLGRLLLDRPQNLSIEELGLYMTEDERAEYDRRVQLGDLIEPIRDAVTGIRQDSVEEGVDIDYGSNFGGVWFDQMNGGRIVLAVADASTIDIDALYELAGGSQHLEILEGQPSEEALRSLRSDLIRQLDARGFDSDVFIDSLSDGRSIRVVTTAPEDVDSLVRSLEAPVAPVRVEVNRTLGKSGDPLDLHSTTDLMPGLRIRIETTGHGAKGCTWGANGSTSSYHYMIMAGHCLDNGGYDNHNDWVGSAVEIGQSEANPIVRLLTGGNTYIKSFDGGDWDMARVESGWANDNCYHWGHCATFIKKRAQHNTWEVGVDDACASLGKSNVWRCGLILEEKVEEDGGDRWVRIAIHGVNGDSGSGVVKHGSTNGTVIDGIIAQSNASESIFNTAYDVQTQLTFNWNCRTYVAYLPPSSWGTCPSVNR